MTKGAQHWKRGQLFRCCHLCRKPPTSAGEERIPGWWMMTWLYLFLPLSLFIYHMLGQSSMPPVQDVAVFPRHTDYIKHTKPLFLFFWDEIMTSDTSHAQPVPITPGAMRRPMTRLHFCTCCWQMQNFLKQGMARIPSLTAPCGKQGQPFHYIIKS